MRLLAVNAGSTSIKVSLLDGGTTVREHSDLESALAETTSDGLAGVAHRVVHGGERTDAVVVDDRVRAELEALTDLAPLHQPPALRAIDACRAALPDVPHVACFDTAFHRTIPTAARTYALPQRLRDKVQVYGFHGLSHAWSARTLSEVAPDARRVVVAHLGGGASLCGVLDGRSMTTTMGFTPLDGLVMASRSGSIDPGAVTWLAENSDEDIAHVLEKESGLVGLCGTGDMREIRARIDAGDGEAAFAIEVYVHRLVSLLGGCVASLGGLDALVFTGGVGENAPAIRAAVAQRMGWLGAAIDETVRPDEPVTEITAAGASVRTFVIHAREDLEIAREAARVLA